MDTSLIFISGIWKAEKPGQITSGTVDSIKTQFARPQDKDIRTSAEHQAKKANTADAKSPKRNRKVSWLVNTGFSR